MKLEICANSFQSANNAQDAGAFRIELCSELSVGGITPSYGLIVQVLTKLSIETYVLIRPRAGNFTYSDSEFDIMKRDIEICKDLGCSGIVSGVLNQDNTIDLKRTKELIELSKPLKFTFHRAFDCISNPIDAMTQLIDLGVDRILTSGQEHSVDQGFTILARLKDMANNKVIIMPGGGVNSKNAKLFKNAGFQELHASASKVILNRNENSAFDMPHTVSDTATIKSILKAIKDEV